MHIVLCYIVHNNRILLLNRNKEPYKDFWALPGGKVEAGEGILAAALREAEEESRLTFSRAVLRGSASEVILDSVNGNELYKYDMSLVELMPVHSSFTVSNEGQLQWMNMAEFIQSAVVVPTDIDMVEKFCFNNESWFYHYEVEYSREKGYLIQGISKSS